MRPCNLLVPAVAIALALATSAAAAAASVGRPAPDFSMVTLDGKVVSLADLKGQVVVINYWATWCGPCRVEMPMFDTYLRTHADQGLRIFSVTIEGSAPPARLRPLAHLLSFPLVTKFRGGGYGMVKRAVPTTYVIDRAGIVRTAQAGSFNADSFDAAVGPLLAQPAPGG
jgi:peroxiredoxin